MKPSLQVRLSQHLALTPQLQQSIRLLQLSTLELHQEVQQMLDQNPFLEPEDEGGFEPLVGERLAAGEDSSRKQETEAPAEGFDGDDAVGEMNAGEFGTTEREDWANGTEGDDFDGIRETPGGAPGAEGDGEGEGQEQRVASSSLQEHLRAQITGMRLSPEDQLALEALIESLDGDGYLADPLEDIADRLVEMVAQHADARAAGETHVDADEDLPGAARDAAAADEPDNEPAAFDDTHEDPRQEWLGRLHCALRWLQSLEPSGVGARDLSECLLLQLAQLPASDVRTLAMRIAEEFLETLARRDMRRLASVTGADEDMLREAQALIVACEPKPGRPFADAESNVIVPDVVVTRSGRGLKVVLNPDVMPKLRINDLYAQMMRGQRGNSGASGMSTRLQEARWFVKNIQQRFDTILRVSKAIVERQKNFFAHGAIAMKPLVLREIADELNLHESTISRVTTAKYMATPMGTFELKYFFGSSLTTEAGGAASSTAVRALIEQFVEAEDAKKPLSDSQLSDMLAEQGITVARRTVAKYREALRIAPASQRRAM